MLAVVEAAVMPNWLSILIAVAVPLGTLLAVFWSRGKSEQKVLNKIDLLSQKLDSSHAAYTTRFALLEEAVKDAKTSRIQLREAYGKLSRRLQHVETVCAMSHPDRPTPGRTATVDILKDELSEG